MVDGDSPESLCQHYGLLSSFLATGGKSAGDLNLPPHVVGQKLARMERDSLEELAQQMFLVLKYSEGKLTVLRREAAVLAQQSPAQGRRPYRNEKNAMARVRSHESALPRGTGGVGRAMTHAKQALPRTSCGGQGSAGAGGGTGGGARHSGTTASSRPPVMPVEELGGGGGGGIGADSGSALSPKLIPRGCTEEQAQRVVDRLYNGSKARVKRQAHEKLGQLNEEVRVKSMFAAGRSR